MEYINPCKLTWNFKKIMYYPFFYSRNWFISLIEKQTYNKVYILFTLILNEIIDKAIFIFMYYSLFFILTIGLFHSLKNELITKCTFVSHWSNKKLVKINFECYKLCVAIFVYIYYSFFYSRNWSISFIV